MGKTQGLFARKPMSQVTDESDGGEHKLKRTLGAGSLIALGIGAIIGAGLFSLTGIAAGEHAGPAVILAFVIAAIGCAFAGMCYSELATMIPIAGSAYTYAYATMGELMAWIIGWDLVLEYAIGAAAVSVSWSRYVVSFLRDFGINFPAQLISCPFESVKLLDGTEVTGIINLPAIFIIIVLSLLLMIGIRESARVNEVIVVIKVAVVLIFIAVGFFFIKAANYTPFIPPLMVNYDAMMGTSYFPGGEEQAYAIGVQKDQSQGVEADGYYLIGTSEVSVTSYHSGELLKEAELPKRYCGISNCFRREAGTYGKDTKGLYRIHQFQKVEQVVLCEGSPEASANMHAELLQNAEEVLHALELPYRVVDVCTGDLGRGQVYKNDIETWMPSRKTYGETHSCSTFHDFQSRRLNIKYETKDGEKKFVHTLNNTCIASPRILIPILEIYQQMDGSVAIPKVLQSYMGGKKKIVRMKV